MTRRVPLGPEADERPDTSRQVHPDEVRLLRRARQQAERVPDGCAIELVPLGEQVGIHPMRTREIGRTWANEDRYRCAGSPGTGRLTEKGRSEPLPRDVEP